MKRWTARITRRDFNALATMQPSPYRFFYERACQTIARLENHILVQGRTTSTQKIACYLLSMSRRLSEQQGSSVVLPMSRYDIADHVGIAVENSQSRHYRTAPSGHYRTRNPTVPVHAAHRQTGRRRAEQALTALSGSEARIRSIVRLASSHPDRRLLKRCRRR